jgi:hypothetical protein
VAGHDAPFASLLLVLVQSNRDSEDIKATSIQIEISRRFIDDKVQRRTHFNRVEKFQK